MENVFEKNKMVTGKGNIAKILNDREGALFFARGVSDSSCTDIYRFRREQFFLTKFYDSGLCIFYFSSIGIFYNDSPYFQHKRDMEKRIKENFKNYNIIRIGNIDWDTNPNTFINFINNKISKGEQVEIKDEFRFLVSKQQLLLLTDNLPLQGQNEINVFGRMGKVKDFITQPL